MGVSPRTTAFILIILLFGSTARLAAQDDWLIADVGNVAVGGSANISGGVFRLTGSGADIWDRADEFFFVFQQVTADFQITARVTFLQHTDPWAKVGLMARDGISPGARNALVFVTPFNGAGFQWRSTANGFTQFTPGGPASYPVWLRLVRTGNTLSGYKSLDGSNWTFIGSTTIDLQQLYVGIALTSHRDGVVAQATVDSVTLVRNDSGAPAAPTGLTAIAVATNEVRLSWTDNSANETGFEIQRSLNGVDFTPLATVSGTTTHSDTYQVNAGTRYFYRVRALNNSGASAWSNIAEATTPPTGTGLPGSWLTEDIFTSGGSATYANGAFTVSGDGADIWDYDDRFRFVYQQLPAADVTITARVDSQQSTHGWAKAGLMLREGLSSSARNAFVFVTPDHGIGFQWRTSSGTLTQYVPGPTNLRAPVRLSLVRTGDTVAGYWSADGNNWQLVGSVTLTFAHQILVGMAVTSHQQGVLSTVNFSNVNLTTGSGGGDLPAGWQNQDIGSVGVAGNASYSAGTFTISGDGRDIWETADAFHFVYQPWAAGNATLIAEVVSLQNTDPWAKVGIMFRQSLSANSPYAMVMLTPQQGSGFQARTSPGASSIYTRGPNPTSGWLALTRSGNVFTAYLSTDGTSWTPIASQTVAMSGTIYIGLAVTSHNHTVLNTSNVRNVQITVP